MSQAEIKTELLRAEFPSLRPDHDPDVERYYELRAIGRAADALNHYNSKLRSRYPDDAIRAEILRSYRLRSPLYGQLLARAYNSLGDRLLERVKRDLKYISFHAENYNPRDAYSTIKAAEAILGMLPRERFEAVAAAERLRRYADILDYCAKPMATAEDLVRAYLNESLEVVKNERKRRRDEASAAADRHRSMLVARDRATIGGGVGYSGWQPSLEAPRRETPARRATAVLDLSNLRFSAADLARIEIPPVLTKVEDKTLAFCFKYWTSCNDPALERVIFLYSRKYGTKHYEIFMAIRQGRRAGHRDEEILSAVSSFLITGYYYSIRGDIYVQRSWATLKAKLEKPAVPQIEAPEAQDTAAKRRTARTRKTRKNAKRPAKRKPALTPEEKEARAQALAAKKAEQATLRAEKKAARDALLEESRAERAAARERRAQEKAGKDAAKAARNAEKAAGKTTKRKKAARSPEEEMNRAMREAKRAVKAEAARKKNANGSVSDQLRKLSGRSYDVFQDRFLARVRASIREVLAAGAGHKSLFTSIPEQAEDLVFSFLRDHYNDPYMDWKGSSEHEKLTALGFSLEDLEPIIEHCYKGL